MLEKWLPKKPAPLTGAPAVRRLKSYSAQSGYVYQYAFEGQRPLPRDAGVEYVFSASADRKTWHAISVHVVRADVLRWEQKHDRGLIEKEWYALAKMSLFAAFDERPDMPAMHKSPVLVREADIDGILETLGLE